MFNFNCFPPKDISARTLIDYTLSLSQAELSGKKGLVPSNFLEDVGLLRDGGVEVFAAEEEAVRRAEEIIQKVLHMQSRKSQTTRLD